VADIESIAEVIKTINDEFGTPTVLVNNTSITQNNLLIRMKNDE